MLELNVMQPISSNLSIISDKNVQIGIFPNEWESIHESKLRVEVKTYVLNYQCSAHCVICINNRMTQNKSGNRFGNSIFTAI